MPAYGILSDTVGRPCGLSYGNPFFCIKTIGAAIAERLSKMRNRSQRNCLLEIIYMVKFDQPMKIGYLKPLGANHIIGLWNSMTALILPAKV